MNNEIGSDKNSAEIIHHLLTKRFLKVLMMNGEIFQLFIDIIRSTFSRPFYFNRLVEQIYHLGRGCLFSKWRYGLPGYSGNRQ